MKYYESLPLLFSLKSDRKDFLIHQNKNTVTNSLSPLTFGDLLFSLFPLQVTHIHTEEMYRWTVWYTHKRPQQTLTLYSTGPSPSWLPSELPVIAPPSQSLALFSSPRRKFFWFNLKERKSRASSIHSSFPPPLYFPDLLSIIKRGSKRI